MPMLGLDVPNEEVDKLFDEFNADGGSEIGLGEMQKMLRRGPTPSPGTDDGGGRRQSTWQKTKGVSLITATKNKDSNDS